MIHVYPNRSRGRAKALFMWPLVLLQVLWLHPAQGLAYASRWANASLRAPV